MISIIIIVKNDKGLTKTLDRLSKIKKPTTTEILVIDASEGKVEYLKSKYSSVIWTSYKNIKSKKITIPEQRNLGIKCAKGEVIVFIDSSCEPQIEWLCELYKLYTQDKELIVAGTVQSNKKYNVRQVGCPPNITEKYLNEAASINILIHKSVFDAVGYFDETFYYSSDTDFTWRAVKKGFKIRFNNHAVVKHDQGSNYDEIMRSYWYGVGRASLYKKYKLIRDSEVLFQDCYFFPYIVYIVLLPITFFFPYYLLFILIPLIRNYKEEQPLNLIINRFSYAMGFIRSIIGFP